MIVEINMWFIHNNEGFSFQIEVVSFPLLNNHNKKIYNEELYFDLKGNTFNIKHMLRVYGCVHNEFIVSFNIVL